MTRNQKWLLGLAVLFMALALWLPLWKIEIWAPQYPEGLRMQISASDIGGNVSQINILNHYIGMKHIVPEEIPELKVIPLILGAFVVLGLVVVGLGRRTLAKIWLSLMGMASVIGMADFYRWGYDYGHNLSPDAPIKIPGFSYQPPLFGYKKILNIEAYSLPDWGTYALSLGIVLAVSAIYGDRIGRSFKENKKRFLFLSLFLSSCTAKVEPIQVGVDHCHNCHMQIADSHFGAELITKNGRIYKFDSIRCLREYLKKDGTATGDVYVMDYAQPGKLIEAKNAYFLRGSTILGPMGADSVASELRPSLEELKNSSAGEIIDWKKLSAASL